MIAVNLHNVSLTFLIEPLFSELSWEIHDDRCVGLIGPNGSGKTTAVNLITGFVKPTEGEIHYRGQNITAWPPYARIARAETITVRSKETGEEMTLDAPLALVWRAHTEPELVKRWATGPADHSLIAGRIAPGAVGRQGHEGRLGIPVGRFFSHGPGGLFALPGRGPVVLQEHGGGVGGHRCPGERISSGIPR